MTNESFRLFKSEILTSSYPQMALNSLTTSATADRVNVAIDDICELTRSKSVGYSIGLQQHDFARKTAVAIKKSSKAEVRFKRKLEYHLFNMGFVRSDNKLIRPGSDDKEGYRQLHGRQRYDLLKDHAPFVKTRAADLFQYFASGSEVVPELIRPRLQVVEPRTMESDLFRLAGLTWSVPVSQGYGRRIRFLVWDEYTGKLMGLIALGDPVFNSRVRDTLIGWDGDQKKRRLIGIMDAFVLGAIPPYNSLLCGKMVACLIRSKEIRDIFNEKYGNYKGVISGKKKNARLVMVTTSSALGRSSLYNRLRLNGTPYFQSIGFTQGWGHFHIPKPLFEEMREFLVSIKHRYANGHRFGKGPNWKMRVVRASLDNMNINPDLLRHGVTREVFVSRLAVNADRYLRGDIDNPIYRDLRSVNEIADLAKERWILRRSQTRSDWRSWNSSAIREMVHARR